MNKKEFAKKCVLSYTEPSLFWIPWKKATSETYLVTFKRYANINIEYGKTAYMIDEEILTSENAVYYIYDILGNYYDAVGNTHAAPFELWSNSISLPKGKYFYKEMCSIGYCKLIKDIIPFEVTGNNDIIITHHQANMITIDYHIELFDMCFYRVVGNKTEDNDDVRYYSRNPFLYTSEHIEETEDSRALTEAQIPLLKIDSVKNYKKDYINKIGFDLEISNVNDNISETLIKREANAEFELPRTVEAWNDTYKITSTYALGISQKFSYITTVDNTNYTDYDINLKNCNYIQNYSLYSTTRGTTYNKYKHSYLSYYTYPTNPNDYYKYEGYNMKTTIISGFDGLVGNITLVGKNTVLYKQDKVTYSVNIKDTVVSPVTGETTTTENNTPSTTTENYNNEVENFNEIVLFKSIFTGLADVEKITLSTPYLYKKKNNNLTCYSGYLRPNTYSENRSIVYGSDIKNKDADTIFVGALIGYDKREE